MYRLRAQVIIEPDERPVLATWGGALPAGFVIDPRIPGLGGRTFGADLAPDATGNDWQAHRLALGIPDPDGDAPSDKTYPIEANFELLNGIDFRQGCFVGQETTSRMKRLGSIRTRMLPIRFDGPPPPFGSEVLNGDLRAGEVLTVEAWDRGENIVLATGALRTVDNQIDLATGTLRLKAEFPNTDERLFPNQFVNVRLRVRTLKDTIVIPAVGVQFGSRGPYAFVVGAENKVAVRDLVLGPVDGAMQAVIKGISPGELVVTEGVDRLREGRPVTIISGESAPPLPPAPPAAPGSGRGAPDGTKKKKKSGA
jgi:folate-binding protein YgfZ